MTPPAIISAPAAAPTPVATMIAPTMIEAIALIQPKILAARPDFWASFAASSDSLIFCWLSSIFCRFCFRACSISVSLSFFCWFSTSPVIFASSISNACGDIRPADNSVEAPASTTCRASPTSSPTACTRLAISARLATSRRCWLAADGGVSATPCRSRKPRPAPPGAPPADSRHPSRPACRAPGYPRRRPPRRAVRRVQALSDSYVRSFLAVTASNMAPARAARASCAGCAAARARAE